ncbi:MAG TPA: hypothetical protein VKA64_08390 [Gammaproteobacteria bacterium]|nr:hypothetical protein [Gammaproteobacteria bacterium]
MASVAVAGMKGGWVVHVRLTETAAQRFERVARAVRGRTLTVSAGRAVFSRARVRVPVSSGVLTSPVLSRQEAERLSGRVRRRRPARECGPGAGRRRSE